MTDEELMRRAGRGSKDRRRPGARSPSARWREGRRDRRPRPQPAGERQNATYHAELMAIDAACKALGGWRLWQCELFVTLEPCPMCSRSYHQQPFKAGRLRRTRPQAGCCVAVLTDLFAPPFNLHPVIESGLLEDEAQALLRNFCDAAGKRKKKIAAFFPWPPLGGGSARRRWGRGAFGHPKYFGPWQGSSSLRPFRAPPSQGEATSGQ